MEDNQRDTRRKNEPSRFKKLQQKRKPKGMKNNFRNDDDFNWGRVLRVILSWSAIILGVFIVMTLFKNTDGEYEVTYQQYQKYLHDDLIKDAVVKKSEISNFD